MRRTRSLEGRRAYTDLPEVTVPVDHGPVATAVTIIDGGFCSCMAEFRGQVVAFDEQPSGQEKVSSIRFS
ncbi:hypothetical protein COCOBI_15-3820 [Coccomyxa sp. Obi]|nr:hypothetical protein COCOBI_15-3820 [Coccomyxa sp. Obi]